MAAEHRPRSRSAAPSFHLREHLAGGAVIAKRGRREEDDSVAIQRMVDLLEADPSLSHREAASKVAAGLKGDPKKITERLRRKHRMWKQAGQLPQGGEAGLVVRKSAGIRSLYQELNTRDDQRKRDLEHAENEARALGIDVSGDLLDLSRALDNRLDSLNHIVFGPPEIAVSAFRHHGVTDPEEAVIKYEQAVEDRKKIQAQLEAVRQVRNLRFTLGIQ